MPKVFLSPSNQTSNTWVTGDTNEEREAVYFADCLQKILTARGVDVVRADSVKPFATKAGEDERINYAKGCDAYIPLHTNAFNKSVKGCRLFVYKKNCTNDALRVKNLDLQQCIFDKLTPLGMPARPVNYQDFARWGELTNADKAGIPSVYSESIFHDNAEDVAWYRANFEAFVTAYADGICQYLGVNRSEKPTSSTTTTSAGKTIYRVQVGAFSVKANAEAYLKKVKDAGFANAYIVESSK